MVIEIIFWLSLLAIVYTYILYPVILLCISSIYSLKKDVKYLFNKKDRRTSVNSDYYPKVAVIIAAFNEENDIENRINNLLSQNYPSENINIYVGSDGSTDRTPEIINSFDDVRLKKYIFKENRGKASVLNDLIKNTNDEEILVLSDANTTFEDNVISLLVRHFNNEDVGVVCGELDLIDIKSKQNIDSMYWKYERLLKFYEGRIGALLGANGANYAIRKSLYKELPNNTIVDDFTIVMDIAVKGNIVVYDLNARATEEVAPDIGAEFNRRVRIGIGNYQALKRYLSFLKPKLSQLYFSYLSHKVFRWFVPHFMLVAFITNIMLIDHEMYKAIFLLQVLVYSLSILTHFLKNRIKLPGVMLIPYFIITMNIALGIGFMKFILGKYQGAWTRTNR